MSWTSYCLADICLMVTGKLNSHAAVMENLMHINERMDRDRNKFPV